jgi:VanZ family protein
MYGGLSGILWWEFLRTHKNGNFPLLHVWIGAIICPIVFSGVVELLQEYCTTYRGGNWLDFIANIFGVLLGSLVSYYVIRPCVHKH